MNMTVHDPATDEDINRFYWVNLPKNYDEAKSYPIILWFHGWGSGPSTNSNYVALG
jgi:predicted peptidase